MAGVSWEELVGWLFVATSSGRLLAYLPQIVAALRCSSGAKSISILTWGYFSLAHFATLLYAIYVLHDSRLAWVFGGNLVVTLILVGIILWKRYWHEFPGAKRQLAPNGVEPATNATIGSLAEQTSSF